MKILVTGSAGFIGMHVAKMLLEDRCEVVGLDNFNDYYSVQLKRDRHALLTAHPNYRGFEGDLCDAPLLARIFKEHRFDAVCHLAAQAGVRYSIINPQAYQKSNLEGFLNILECCRHARVPRLVYASSSSVYGGNTKLPFSERDPVETPVSLYAATKRANELMAHTYVHLYGMQAIGLRFFTVYGPWGRPDMAAWLFTEAILKRQPIKVFNQGNLSRDFTYVDDIIYGVKASLFEKALGPCEILNLGNHKPEDLMEFIGVLARCLGVEPIMDFQPMQPGDVLSTFADTTLARTRLGFEPRVSIADGLPRFVTWYRDYQRT
jgi:UDP-glucuronate 4-epimerase